MNQVKIFFIIFFLDILTTIIGINYFNCIELNTLPIWLSLTLRFTFLIIFYYVKRLDLLNTVYFSAVVSNVVNFFRPVNPIEIVLPIYITYLIYKYIVKGLMMK
jgi:hypothetical protein